MPLDLARVMAMGGQYEADAPGGLAYAPHVLTGALPLCVNCVHHDSRNSTAQEHQCSAFASLVTGAGQVVSCSLARADGALCGKQGQLFEVRAT